MHFDLFYELSSPPGPARSEASIFHDALAEIEEAERSGFRTAWLAEHHFMPGYSHSSAPDLFLAAASQRTHTLRLGHAIVPLPYHHPVHVAERAATLDVLSGGRLEFGFGRGFSPREYQSFGIAMRESRTRTAESLAILKLAFGLAPFSFSGTHFTLEDLDVLPKTVQRPHPPLWMAAVSPESFELAAELGVGVLVGPFKPWFMARQDIKRYRARWRALHGPDGARPRVAMTVGLLCLEDGARARALGAEAFPWFYQELFRQTAPVLQKLYDSYDYYRRVGHLRFLLSRSLSLAMLTQLGLVVVGTPGDCMKQLEPYRAAGVDHLLCAIGAGAVTSEQVRASIQTVGRHLVPHFQ